MAETYYPNPGATQRQHEYLLGGAYASGVFGHPEDDPVVYANGSGTREVRIRASRRAIVEGYGWENDAAEIVKTLAANSSGSTRIDLVVLRLNRTAGFTVTVQVVQGTPGAGAPSPSYDSAATGNWELPLAEVTVASGATTLASSTVKNRAWYLGSNGQIRCTQTPDTRPPGEAGLVAFETDTGRFIGSNGPNWTAITDDSGLLSMTLQAGWSATVNKVQRRGGSVVLALSGSRSTNIPADTEVKVAQLPAGTFPTFEVPGSARYESSAGLSVGLRVTTAGGVYIKTPPSVGINAGRDLTGSLSFHAA